MHRSVPASIPSESRVHSQERLKTSLVRNVLRLSNRTFILLTLLENILEVTLGIFCSNYVKEASVLPAKVHCGNNSNMHFTYNAYINLNKLHQIFLILFKVI